LSYRIFLAEDDRNLNAVLTSYLKNEGWQVCSFMTGAAAKAAIKDAPHLWILDIMLPDSDGYQLLREIKESAHQVPVIFISARDADIDRIIGLEMGSDDYLPKPFLPRELVIRARKLLERVYGTRSKPLLLQVKNYTIDEAGRRAYAGYQQLDLTAKEFDLLVSLVRNLGQTLSRNQLLDRVWGSDYFGSDRVVDDLVRRLRKKMPDLHIETLYGYGYRLVNS
jgi:two-component system response regulator CssR